MFEVGDEVYSKRFGEGIVTDVDDNDLYIYPIHVQWKNSCKRSIFTPEGKYNISFNDPDTDICFLKVGKFQIGDYVYSQFSGVGQIIKIGKNENLEYPIEVKWCENKTDSVLEYDFFTLDGRFFSDRKYALRDIVHIEDSDYEGKDEGTVERMEDALDKKVEDAINPSHYKVKGLPEAIDMMNHLMDSNQYEGFLWGNILKYAYRYGRKGDKAETAGKIAWYANQLKDLAEESEKNEEDDIETTH